MSYQDNWELVTLCVRNIPVDGEETSEEMIFDQNNSSNISFKDFPEPVKPKPPRVFFNVVLLIGFHTPAFGIRL